MLIASRAWGFLRAGRNSRFGVRVSEFGTGGDFPNPLDNDTDAGDEAAGVEFCPVFAAQPASGVLTVRTDGSLSLVGAADGTYVLPYALYTFTPGDAASVDEGDTSATVTVGAAGTAPGRADETDEALAPGAVQIGAAGLGAEVDTALQLGAVALLPAGLATETDQALALVALQRAAVGAADETDTALALIAAGPLPVGLAEETDTALALLPAGAAEDESLGGPRNRRPMRFFDDGLMADRDAKEVAEILAALFQTEVFYG